MNAEYLNVGDNNLTSSITITFGSLEQVAAFVFGIQCTCRGDSSRAWIARQLARHGFTVLQAKLDYPFYPLLPPEA